MLLLLLIRAFEVLRSQSLRSDYLLTKQVMNWLPCMYGRSVPNLCDLNLRLPTTSPSYVCMYVGVHADDDNLLTPLVGVPYGSVDIAQSVYV